MYNGRRNTRRKNYGAFTSTNSTAHVSAFTGMDTGPILRRDDIDSYLNIAQSPENTVSESPPDNHLNTTT